MLFNVFYSYYSPYLLNHRKRYDLRDNIIAGSLEAAYSLNWGAREIWGKGGGRPRHFYDK